MIDFGHRDGEGHGVTEGRIPVVGGPDRETVGAGAVLFVGYPSKLPAGWVERCSLGRPIGQSRFETLQRLIGVIGVRDDYRH